MLSRRYLSLLAAFALLGGVAALQAQEAPKETKEKKKKEQTDNLVAQIRLHGGLSDAPAAVEMPFGGGGSGTLSEMLDRLKKAKTDENVKALYLQFDGLSISWGKLHELRAGIADFKKSGKKVVAYLEQGGQMEYLLATSADEIVIPPGGGVELSGLSYEIMYMKDLLARFGASYDVVAMGDFKSAMEQFVRSGMSPANRQQWEELVDDFYSIFVDTLVSSRPGLTPEKARQLIDKGLFTAKDALEAKLVDRVAYPDAILPQIKKDLGNSELALKANYGRKKQDEIDFGNPFAIFKLLAPSKDSKVSAKPKIAVIYAEGGIVTGRGGPSLFGGNSVGSTTMVEAIRKAEQEDTVKAIVLRVDSPGGSALASDLIWHELKRSKKPVIASMGEVAASGGYYISMPAKRIFATPGTITGSIGVVGGKPVLGGTMKQFGVNTETISRGKMANLATLERPFNAEEREAIVAMMMDIYDQFLSKAYAGREAAGNTKIKSVEELKKLAGGRIWSGKAAKENGLIDELGTLEDAIAYAKKSANLGEKDEVELMVLPRPRSFFDSLLEADGPGLQALVPSAELKALAAIPGLRQPLQVFEMLIRQPREKVWLLGPLGSAPGR